MPRVSTLLLSLTVFLAAPASAQETVVEFYEVEGDTFTELMRSIGRDGPFAKRTGRRHPGITEVGFGPSWTVRPSSDGCDLVSTTVDLRLRIVLPRWPDRAEAPPALRRRWDELRSDVETHEREHEAIARRWHLAMLDELNAPRSARTCPALNAAMEARARRLIDAHRREQLAFDGIR